MYNLFLDDIRNPKEVYEYTFRYLYLEKEWKVVKNYDEFVETIQVNGIPNIISVSYTHLRAHETVLDLVCRLLLEKKKKP